MGHHVAALDVVVDYAGGLPGSAMIMIDSNDSDESPMPISAYGETEFLDPGEAAIPFTAESWVYDHDAKGFFGMT